jgi:hypothetical protein
MATAETKQNKNLDQLNSFLRGEISAVETYRIALEKLPPGHAARGALETCRTSHVARVLALQSRVTALGGTPAEGSGPWGALVTAFESGAALLGERAAIAALEQGEDHGLADYRADLGNLDDAERAMVTSQLLPQQAETHEAIRKLKHSA